jgi:hypothetical protein
VVERPEADPLVRAAAVVRVCASVMARPSLWGTAAREVAVLAGPGWWRRWPLLPVPAPGYLHFRLQTAYGDADRPPEAADVVTWLRWCKRMRALRPTG